MANHNQSGGRNAAPPEDPEPSWRPEDRLSPTGFRDRETEDDRDHRSWQDRDVRGDDRRAGERDRRRGDVLRRYGEPGYARDRDRFPFPGSFEDRNRDVSVDDRFTARQRSSYWQDRTGYEVDEYGTQGSSGRDLGPERAGPSRGSHGHDERMGYSAGSYQRGFGSGGTQDTAQRDLGPAPHIHRGTGPHRGKGPIGYQRSDERIRELVCEALTDDDQIDASQIEVTVSHGEVTLSGTVDARRTKREAEDCTCSVSGVRDVQNLLRVSDDGSAAKAHPSGQDALGNPDTESSAQAKKHRA